LRACCTTLEVEMPAPTRRAAQPQPARFSLVTCRNAKNGLHKCKHPPALVRHGALVVALVVATRAAALPPAAVVAPAADEIVVSGERAAVTSTIDRKAYDVQKDLQAVGGSVADLLRNLPSVDVDAAGAVSLRGDSNVQILIDGKPSVQMAPATRADTLQSLPADGIQSIEVITNPSARYKPEGSGGIINIVTRKNRKPGQSGTAFANAGTDGRYSLGGTAAYHGGRLDLNAALTLRQDVPRRPFASVRTQTDPMSGTVTSSSQDTTFISHRTSKIGTVGAGYDLTKADRISGSLTYGDRSGAPQTTEHNAVSDSNGAIISDSDRIGSGREHEVTSEGSASYKHSFSGKDHAFTLDFRRGEEVENQSRTYRNVFRIPALPVTIDRQQPHGDMIERELTAEYARPLAAHAKMLIGYNLQRNDDSFDTRGETIDPLFNAVTVDPNLTSRFVYRQTVHGLYGTYERVFASKLTAIIGFRAEATSTDANQVSIGQVNRTDYVRAYPTLHLEYALSDVSALRLSYSHRIVRPDPEELNPFPMYSGPLNVRAGNPNLKPQETEAVEGAFNHSAHGLHFEITPYYRHTKNLFTEVVRFISPTVLLTTQDNLGSSTAIGSEFAVDGKAGPSLSFGLSGNLFYNSIDAGNLGIAGSRSVVSVTGKGNLEYKITSRDLIQLTANYTGRRLLAQGYRLPTASANIGYRHQLKPDLAVVATIADIFDSIRDRAVIDTSSLHEVTFRRRSIRTATLALSWSFGGTAKKSGAKFDYSNQ
jgi:outer membrane receptor protein involved in Fe transport